MKKPLLSVLGWYQQYRGLRPDACRYDPTCSAYAMTAVEVHGVAKGLYLATRRVLRCHPLGGRGYDPVPLPRSTPSSLGAPIGAQPLGSSQSTTRPTHA